jgi:folate-binding protein YgfZ
VSENAESEIDQTATTVVNQSDRGVLVVSGADRASWLNGVVTSDVQDVRPGRAGFGLLLSKQGKIQTDFWMTASEGELFLAIAPGTHEHTLVDLDRMLVMEDAELSDRSSELVQALLVGPRASELAQTAGEISGSTWGAATFRGTSAASVVLPRAHFRTWVAGTIARGARAAAASDWDALRLRLGIGVFGVDYGPADNPHEAGLDRVAVSWSKGCYLGQEVVFMQDARGKLKRRLVTLAVEGGLPAAGSELHASSGEVVGELTSVAAIASGAVALGRIRAPHFEPGSRLVASGFPAEVQAPAGVAVP